MDTIRLRCNFDYGSGIVPADVTISHEPSGEIIATVRPDRPIVSTFKQDCYLESVSGSAYPRIARTHCLYPKVTYHSANGVSTVTLEYHLFELLIEKSDQPLEADEVSVAVFIANLSFGNSRSDSFDVTIQGIGISVRAVSPKPASHVAVISKVAFGRLDEVVETVRSMFSICSFMTGKLAELVRIDVSRNGAIASTRVEAGLLLFDHGMPVVHPLFFGPGEITLFLEHAYPLYRKLDRELLLGSLIGIGIRAKHASYEADKLLLMANWLEILRYNYALNVGVPIGTFKQRPNDQFVWVNNTQSAKGTDTTASFRDILVNFCNRYGISGWSNDFKDIRNEIVHTGMIGGTNHYQRYLDLHHFCDRVVLTLLEYDKLGGKYIPINQTEHPDPNRTGNNVIQFIP